MKGRLSEGGGERVAEMSRADEMQDSRRWELQASGEMEDEGIGEK